MYKYIVTDMDGTLLDSKKKIGNVAKNELQRLKKRGCRIVLASGRHFRELPIYIKELDLSSDDIIICCDGQYICNCFGDIIRTGHFLSLNDIMQISNLTGHNQMLCFTDTMDIYIGFGIIRRIKRAIYAKLNHKKILQIPNTKKIQKSVERIEKIVISSNMLTMEELRTIEKLYTVHCLKNNQFEILHKEVNKYSALKALDAMGMIDINQVVYFGDDANDLECFMNVESCIAMENAIEELKKRALFVTKSCDEDGVGYALRELNI